MTHQRAHRPAPFDSVRIRQGAWKFISRLLAGPQFAVRRSLVNAGVSRGPNSCATAHAQVITSGTIAMAPT
jgi:hypothetical protein